MDFIGASSRYNSVMAGEPVAGCQHVRVLHGGGTHFSDDLCTCVDCGVDRYEESFPKTLQTRLRKRPKTDGVYVDATPAAYEAARDILPDEAPLFGIVS